MEKISALTWPQSKLVRKLSHIFKKNSFQLYLVGGAVRSLLLKEEPLDLDFTTNATPQQIMKMFSKTIPTGIRHGTISVIWKKQLVEITTFRQESSYTDSRHPDKIHFVSTLQEDLSRRDFTINALAYDALTGKIYDYFQGREDLEKRVIRAIGNACQRFEEDTLRILRACRFACVLNFKIEKQTYLAMKLHSYKLNLISAERIYKEFVQILKAKKPSQGLKLLKKISFFRLFVTNELKSSLWSKLDAFSSDFNAEETYLAKLIIFCLSLDQEDRLNFLKALKFPNYYQKKVQHICPLLEQKSYRLNDKDARTFLSHLQKENLNLYLLSVQKLLNTDAYEPWKSLLLTNSSFAIQIKDLNITGEDLISRGLKGKEVGENLKKALLLVLDNPTFNQKHRLLSLLGLE